MATLTFTDKPTEDAPDAPVEQKAVVVKENHSPVEYTDNRNVQGEVGREDYITPRLNIVAKTGELSTLFPSGSIVLNRAHNLGTGPLTVVALTVKKTYREAVDFNDDERGRVFNTAEEVREAGLRVGTPTTKVYGEEAAPEASIVFWIECPSDASPELAENFDVQLPSGRKGTLGLYTAARTSYNGVAKVLFTALRTNKVVKEKGFEFQAWALTAPMQKWEKNIWYQGQLLPAGKLSDEDGEALKQLAQG